MKRVIAIMSISLLFMFTFVQGQEASEGVYLFFQGYRVPLGDYLIIDEDHYKIKAPIFLHVGLDYPQALVDDQGFIDSVAYRDYLQTQGHDQVGFGLNGDGHYVFFVNGFDFYKDDNHAIKEDEQSSLPSGQVDGYGIHLVKELSSDHFDGKHPGSRDNKDIAYMLYEESRLLGAKTELLPYDISVAHAPKSQLTVNGRGLDLMVDYMPNGSSSTSNYEGPKEVIYIGSGKTLSDLDLNNKCVVFSWNDEDGNFGGGIMDRYLPILSKGASEIFVIANGEMPIGYYEHPLLARESGYINYISQAAFEKHFEMENNFNIQETSVHMAYAFQKNIGQATAYNVIAEIEGQVEESLVLMTNYDGWGRIGDLNFQTLRYDSVGPATFLRLIDYYSTNKPYYSLKFVFTGDKWTGQVGVDEILKYVGKDKIKSFIDVYALGGYVEEQIHKPFIMKNTYSQAAWVDHTSSDFGNSFSNKITRAGYESLLIRGQATGVGDLRRPDEDVFSRYNIKLFNVEMDFIKETIRNFKPDYEMAVKDYSINHQEVYIGERIFKYAPTKFIDVYYDQAYAEDVKMDLTLLNDLDKVYLNIMKLNYYSAFVDRPKFYIDRDALYFQDQGLIWKRQGMADGDDMPYADEKRVALYSRMLNLANFSHEINHVVNYIHFSSVGASNGSLDESQGKNFSTIPLARLFRNDAYTIDQFMQAYWMNNHENGMPLLVDGSVDFDFRKLESFTIDGKFWNSDMIEGTMLDFIRENYGYNAMRRFVMKSANLSPHQQYTDLIADAFALTYEDLYDHFIQWYISEGAYRLQTTYDDNLTAYDYELIHAYEDPRLAEISTPAFKVLQREEGHMSEAVVYPDAKPSTWAESAINDLKALKHFKPEAFKDYSEDITRGTFIYIAVRLYEVLSNQEVEVDETLSFKDTDDIYALKALTIGLTTGLGEGIFAYDDLLTRQELATLMMRVVTLLDIDMKARGDHVFADHHLIASWAVEAIYLAKSNEILSGLEHNKVAPKGHASVEVALVIANRILQEKHGAVGKTRQGQPIKVDIYKPLE